MTAITPSVTLHQDGISGSNITLQNTGITEHQEKVYAVFERVIKDEYKYTTSSQQNKLNIDQILENIKQIPIKVVSGSEHNYKKIILTMMTAFKILEKAHGKPEFDQTLSSVKTGWWYFSSKKNDLYEKQDFTVTFYSEKTSSPVEDGHRFQITIDEKTTGKLFAELEKSNLAGPNVILTQDLDFKAFKDFVGSYVSQTSLDLDKKAQFEIYLENLKIHAPTAQDEIDALKDKSTPEEVVNGLKAIATTLGVDASSLDIEGELQDKAKAIIASIQEKITAAINAQLAQS